MIQVADILASVKARWDRDKTLRQLVRGGLHHAPPPAVTPDPYARFVAEPEPPEWTSGKVYIQDWLVEVSLWSTAGPVDSGNIARAIDRLFNRDRPQDFLLPGPQSKVLDVAPADGPLETETATREAKDTLLLHRRYNFTIQAER